MCFIYIFNISIFWFVRDFNCGSCNCNCNFDSFSPLFTPFHAFTFHLSLFDFLTFFFEETFFLNFFSENFSKTLELLQLFTSWTLDFFDCLYFYFSFFSNFLKLSQFFAKFWKLLKNFLRLFLTFWNFVNFSSFFSKKFLLECAVDLLVVVVVSGHSQPSHRDGHQCTVDVLPGPTGVI